MNREKTQKRTNKNMKRPDFTNEEAVFLSALLIDNSADESPSPFTALNNNMLFSLPFHQDEIEQNSRQKSWMMSLWQAFEDGVNPKTLVKKASSHPAAEDEKALLEQEDDDNTIDSEESVKGKVEDDISSCSSWNEEDGAPEHYDAWEVLKDEYAEDFGFDYREHSTPDLDEDQGNVFRILGTSADDIAAQPHVLSPPLMDALMSFLPDTLENQNFWLKYSLVRDGASMETLKHYVRASTYNVLAIETTTGNVFGAFTASPWRNHVGAFEMHYE